MFFEVSFFTMTLLKWLLICLFLLSKAQESFEDEEEEEEEEEEDEEFEENICDIDVALLVSTSSQSLNSSCLYLNSPNAIETVSSNKYNSL